MARAGLHFVAGDVVHGGTGAPLHLRGTAAGVPPPSNGPPQVWQVYRHAGDSVLHVELTMQNISEDVHSASWLNSIAAAAAMAVENDYNRLYNTYGDSLVMELNVNVRFPDARVLRGEISNVWRTVNFQVPYNGGQYHGGGGHPLALYMAGQVKAFNNIGNWDANYEGETLDVYDRLDFFVDFFYHGARRALPGGGCSRSRGKTLRTDLNGEWRLTSGESKDNNCGFVALLNAYNTAFPQQKKTHGSMAQYRVTTGTVAGDLVTPLQLSLIAANWLCKLVVHNVVEINGQSGIDTHVYNTVFGARQLDVFLHEQHYYNIEKFNYLPPAPAPTPPAEPVPAAMEEDPTPPVDDYTALRRSLETYPVTLLHGAAGTGKSYQIRSYVSDMEDSGKKVVVAAFTGVAAFNIGGGTLHSIFGINVKSPNAKASIARLRRTRKLDGMDVLVIDEVSTLSGRLLQLLNEVMCGLFNNNRVFGGKKILLAGDVCQAPPCESGDWFFYSGLWKRLCDEKLVCTVSYSTNHRNVEPENFELFQRLRLGTPNDTDLAQLRARVQTPPPNTLHCFFLTNRVAAYNNNIFARLPGESKSYPALVTEKGRKAGRYHLPPPKVFKLGCRVMLEINLDVSTGLINGAMGDVSKLGDNYLVVDIERLDGTTTPVRIEYSGRLHDDLMEEIPLVLAYALTISKVEGLTVPRIAIELNTNGNSGSHQRHYNILYVALSRTQRLSDIYLLPNPQFSDIRADPASLSAMSDFTRYHYEPKFCEPAEEPAVNRNKPTLSVFNSKGGGDKAYKKQLFFDFETYNDAENGRTRIYYAAAKYVVEGQQVGPNLIRHELDDGQAFCNDLFQLVTDDCDRWVNHDHTEPGGDQPIHLIAYNGGRFDMHFVMQYLDRFQVDTRWLTRIIAKGTDLIMLRVMDTLTGRIAVEMHDMMHLLSFGSLRDNLKTYNPTASITKGYFPHDAVNRLGPQATFSHDVAVSIEEFPEGDRKEVLALVADTRLDLAHYDMKNELDEYCMADVLVLEQLYSAFNKLTMETLGKNCMAFVSAASMSWFGFLTHLPAEVRVANTAYAKGGPAVKKNKTGMIETLIYKSTLEENEFIRTAVVGGKCGPRVLSTTNEPHVLLDMCGMYSSAMRDGVFPYGQPHWGTEAECAALLHTLQCGGELPFTIALVDCALHPLELEPCVGYRDGGHTYWDTGRREQAYSNVALDLIRSNGGVFNGVKKMLVWPSACKLFNEWIVMTEKIKQAGKDARSEGLEKLGKNLANNTYGATLKSDKHNEVVFINGEQALADFYLEHELTAVLPRYRGGGGDELLRLCYAGDRRESKGDLLAQRPAYLGVFVLDYSKRALDAVVSAGNPDRRSVAGVRLQPLYGDTDSLLVPVSWLERLHAAGLLGSTNGLMADDLNKRCYDTYNNTHQLSDCRFFIVWHAVCPAPKIYSLLYDSADGRGAVNEKTVAKGIPRRGVKVTLGGDAIGSRIGYADLCRAVEARDSDDPTYLSIHRACGFKRAGTRLSRGQTATGLGLYDIYNLPLTRQLTLGFTGRKIWEDDEERRFTVPLHYPDKRARLE